MSNAFRKVASRSTRSRRRSSESVTRPTSTRGAPVRLFVDFLGNLYTAQELGVRSRGFHLLARLGADGTTEHEAEAALYDRALSRYYPEHRVGTDGPDIQDALRVFFGDLDKAKDYKEIVSFAGRARGSAGPHSRRYCGIGACRTRRCEEGLRSGGEGDCEMSGGRSASLPRGECLLTRGREGESVGPRGRGAKARAEDSGRLDHTGVRSLHTRARPECRGVCAGGGAAGPRQH